MVKNRAADDNNLSTPYLRRYVEENLSCAGVWKNDGVDDVYNDQANHTFLHVLRVMKVDLE